MTHETWSVHKLGFSLCIYCGRQVMSTRTGISFLMGIASSDGGSIMKSDGPPGNRVARKLGTKWVKQAAYAEISFRLPAPSQHKS